MKIMAMIFVAAMSVSLMACGTENQTSGDTESINSQISVERNESTVSDTEPQETLEPEPQQTTGTEAQPTLDTETQPIVETEAPSLPSFDTSWASNEFEYQIAEPAFESWEVKDYIEGKSWVIFVKDVYYDNVKAYAEDLQFYGFSRNIDENDNFNGLAYIFNASNETNYHIRLVFEAVSADGKGNFSLEISK